MEQGYFNYDTQKIAILGLLDGHVRVAERSKLK
jgi:hypothetical protein